MKVRLHDISCRYKKYALIITYEEGEFLLVQHHNRSTWEVPGGHHEKGEDIIQTAHRELFEETGAMEYELQYLYDYSVEHNGETNFGGLFRADITRRDPLPSYEIERVERFCGLPPVEDMTYGDIQHQLIKLIEEKSL